jgi:DNA polymerase-3 subunit delta'
MAKRPDPASASKATSKAAPKVSPRARIGEQPPEERPKPVHHEGPVLFGQDAATAQLSRAIGSGQMHHAWILHGPAGVGKCTAAIECARLLLDPESGAADVQAFKAPRATRTCELIDAGSHPDLHIVRKERADDSSIKELRDRKQTNIPLDLLRELMIGGTTSDGKTFDSPVWRGAYLGHDKVFVIDEAELLDPYGQNALLKTLEEPPPGTYIFLVTTQEDRLLPTIRSRCQRVAFRALDAAAMDAWFARAAVVPDERPWLAGFAEGSPGTAELAHRHGLRAWSDELLPRFARLEEGRFDATLADRLAELVGEFAERVVKENPKASKEAANRLGTRCALLTIATRVRAALADGARRDDAEALARAARRVDLVAELEREVRANVNLKHALANLVAQWGAA